MDALTSPMLHIDNEGRMAVSAELARAIIAQVSMVCEYHGLQGSPMNAAMLMSLCSGFALGVFAPTRDNMNEARDALASTINDGVRAGMKMNPYLPPLNG